MSGRTSSVWDSFNKVGDGSLVKCRLCEKQLKFNGSTTSSMREHLNRMHISTTTAVVTQESKAAVGQQAQSMQRFLGRQTITDKRKNEITALIACWCTGSLRPLSIVGDSGFVKLLKLLEPGYKVPTRNTMAAVIRKDYEDLRKALLLVLDAVDGISVTTDLWSSSMNLAYATFTGHMIDDDWTLRAVCLDNPSFPDRHTAENIASFTKSVLKDLCVERSKLVAVVSDQAANMVAAWKILKSTHPDLYAVACVCHRLQTAIRHALELTAVSKLLGSCRRLVGHFNHSNVATHALKQQQVKEGVRFPLGVASEVATRWNSTHAMLARLNQLRLPITYVMNDITVTKTVDQSMNLTASQWKHVAALATTLEPFRDATNDLSSSKQVTVSTVLPIMLGLVGECESQDDDTAFLANFKALLAQKIQEKFDLCNIQPYSCEAIASALDPRFKSLAFLDEMAREDVFLEVKLLASGHSGEAEEEQLEPPAKRPGIPETTDCASPPSLKKQSSLLSRLTKQSQQQQQQPHSQVNNISRQMSLYREADGCDIDANPLDWWKAHDKQFPSLAKVARRILLIPASSAESERNFSTTGILTEKRRARLGPENVRSMLFVNKNRAILRPSAASGSSTLGTAATAVTKPEPEPLLPVLSIVAADGDESDIEMLE